MNILVLADVPSKYLWDFYEEGRLSAYDLILSAGALPASYLSFLVTFASCPVFYVRGNHDSAYSEKPPEGCICIEDQLVEYQGLRILGLGGSMRYRPGECQYTEKEMQKRIRKLWWKLHRRKGFDLLLTHAPAKGLGDQEDLCHQGFSCFRSLLDQYQPQYMVHGHVHMNYGQGIARELTYGNTTIINAYEKYQIKAP